MNCSAITVEVFSHKGTVWEPTMGQCTRLYMDDHERLTLTI